MQLRKYEKFISVFITLWYKFVPGITVGRNCRIWPGSILNPPIEIDDNVEIGRPIEKNRNHRLQTIIGSNSHIRSNAVIYEGTKIGHNASIGHNIVVRERSVFGENLYIKANTYVGVDVVAGDRVTIADLVGDRAVIDNDVTCLGKIIHASQGHHRGEIEPAPHIGEGVFVGRQAILVGSIHIGQEAFIKAGAIIKSNVISGARVDP